jgi:L-lactate dehydrogenase complex protein LldG
VTGAREQILARVRAAHAATGTVAAAAGDAAAAIPRDYLEAHVTGPAAEPAQLADLLAENLADYRAHVHQIADPAEIAPLVRELLGGPRLLVPPGLPAEWVPDGPGVERLDDRPPLTAAQLDAADAVLTGCATAIAETGTLVLDAGPGQGRRALTLVPDHHICVVTPDRILASLPQALLRLRADRPLTWIAGPSATSDIELDRVEGVHGPRRLDVLLLAPGTTASAGPAAPAGSGPEVGPDVEPEAGPEIESEDEAGA